MRMQAAGADQDEVEAFMTAVLRETVKGYAMLPAMISIGGDMRDTKAFFAESLALKGPDILLPVDFFTAARLTRVAHYYMCL